MIITIASAILIFSLLLNKTESAFNKKNVNATTATNI
jgi:hypothetical protein